MGMGIIEDKLIGNYTFIILIMEFAKQHYIYINKRV